MLDYPKAHPFYVCAGCASARGVCRWRNEFFCGACTGALVRLQRSVNEIPTAAWEDRVFLPGAVRYETAIVQEWIEQ